MIKYLVVRILTSILVLILVSVSVFMLFFSGTPDVAQRMAGKMATPQVVAEINHRLGLDQPIWKQYLDFIRNAVLHGNLGEDYYHQQPVTKVLAQAAPASIAIALGAAVIWLAIGIFNGVVSAVRPRSVIDRGLTVFSLFFYSFPSFLLGTVFLYFLYYKLTQARHGHEIFPPGGYVPLSAGLGSWFMHLILPWITLALLTAASYTRFTRGSMLEVLSEDYIRTARAKGLSERRVTYKHALRSALTPVVTQFGIDLGALAGGTLVTEQVFSIHGLGWTSINSIEQQNLPLILGTVMIASAAVVVANFLVDLFYGVLDPRVRLY